MSQVAIVLLGGFFFAYGFVFGILYQKLQAPPAVKADPATPRYKKAINEVSVWCSPYYPQIQAAVRYIKAVAEGDHTNCEVSSIYGLCKHLEEMDQPKRKRAKKKDPS